MTRKEPQGNYLSVVVVEIELVVVVVEIELVMVWYFVNAENYAELL